METLPLNLADYLDGPSSHRIPVFTEDEGAGAAGPRIDERCLACTCKSTVSWSVIGYSVRALAERWWLNTISV